MPKDLVDTNQIIHEWLDGCFHKEIKYHSAGRIADSYETCAGCGIDWELAVIPDYENDLNAVREAELKAIEEFGELMYWDELERGLEHPTAVNAITAPASVRAEAIRNLVEENNG